MLHQQLSTVLECMRDELDDHRLAINDSTDEMSATNECVTELSRKLDRVADRVEELFLKLGLSEEKSFKVQPLTEREKSVFQALYAMTEAQPCASYDQLARKCGLSRSIVMDHIASVVHKGVPVLKKLHQGKVYLRIDEEFRRIQAKENVLGLNALLTAWV